MYMSIFSLRESEKGGVQNVPSRVTDDPQGGIIVTPYFGSILQRMKSKPKEAGGKAGWGLGVPSIVKNSPQATGIVFYPIFNDVAKYFLDKHGKKEASKNPVKPKSPKPLHKKGKPVHKKLHDNPHPILAESYSALIGWPKKSKQSEADSSSMVPAMTAKGTKRESSFKIVSSRFREKASSSDTPNKFRVVLLEEGMGNSHDSFYYTKEALDSAVDLFTGLKIMADHPTMEEEEIRPERSTRDILGHYENLAVEEGDLGQHQLCGDVDVLPGADCDWARVRMVRAVENAKKFPGRDFIGLSINASGPSEKTPIQDVIDIAPDGAKQKLVDAQAEGVEIVRVVNQINKAVSCDLVTEAGAGGKILNIIGDNDDAEKAG